MENIKNQLSVKNTKLVELKSSLSILKSSLESVEKNVDNFEYQCSDDEFDSFLGEVYGDVNICGFEYPQSRILKEFDNVAYSCMKLDYESNKDLDSCDEYTEMVADKERIEGEIEDIESEVSDLEEEIEELQVEINIIGTE